MALRKSAIGNNRCENDGKSGGIIMKAKGEKAWRKRLAAENVASKYREAAAVAEKLAASASANGNG
jgi:hypothetical protein